MTRTVIPTMAVEDVELRTGPSLLTFAAHPIDCDHLWEPHLWEVHRAYCPRCGSLGRWDQDPRAREESRS